MTASKPHIVIAQQELSLRLMQGIHSFRLDLLPDNEEKGYLKELLKSKTGNRKVKLILEDILGAGQPPIVDVYLNLPNPKQINEEHFAGALGLYGLELSSTPGRGRDGKGMAVTLDITGLLPRLVEKANWSDDYLDVYFVLKKDLAETDHLIIGNARVISMSA